MGYRKTNAKNYFVYNHGVARLKYEGLGSDIVVYLSISAQKNASYHNGLIESNAPNRTNRNLVVVTLPHN